MHYLQGARVTEAIQLDDKLKQSILVSSLGKFTSVEPNSQELLVMNYLQRARVTEAIQLDDKLKQSILVSLHQ